MVDDFTGAVDVTHRATDALKGLSAAFPKQFTVTIPFKFTKKDFMALKRFFNKPVKRRLKKGHAQTARRTKR